MRFGEVIALFGLGLLRGSVFVFGLLWGSFLNVVIYRVPRDMSVVRPASHCPGCGKPIAGYDNVPVLSYLILRGRARCCGARMSPRYPLVELIGGAASLAVFEVHLRGLASSTTAPAAAALYLAYFSLCLGLVAAAFIDAEHMFLPDSITLGGVVVGIVTATIRGMPFTDALLGAGIGFAAVWVPFGFLYPGFTGRTGMGMGDAKLLALAGAWFGWPGAIFVLFAGALQGTAYALVARVLGISTELPDAVKEDLAELERDAAAGDEDAKKALEEDPLTAVGEPFILRWLGIKPKPIADVDSAAEGEDEPPPKAKIPFGPFLILAILELVFAREWLKDRFADVLWWL